MPLDIAHAGSLDGAVPKLPPDALPDATSGSSAPDSSGFDSYLHDAYSRAVTAAVARVAPAVAHVGVERAKAPRGAREGAGSGFLITPDGYLVTNSHVAGGATRIEVTLSDGRTAGAEIVGDDPDSDLAVLKVAADDLTWCRFGDTSRSASGRSRSPSAVPTASSTP